MRKNTNLTKQFRQATEINKNHPQKATTTNPGEGMESNDQSCHIIIFKMSRFWKKNMKACKEIRKCGLFIGEKKTLIETVTEQTQVLDLLEK